MGSNFTVRMFREWEWEGPSVIELATEAEAAKAEPQNVRAELSRILLEPKPKVIELSRLSRENDYSKSVA